MKSFYHFVFAIFFLFLLARSGLYVGRIWQEAKLPIYVSSASQIEQVDCELPAGKLSFEQQVEREYFLLDKNCEK